MDTKVSFIGVIRTEYYAVLYDGRVFSFEFREGLGCDDNGEIVFTGTEPGVENFASVAIARDLLKADPRFKEAHPNFED